MKTAIIGPGFIAGTHAAELAGMGRPVSLVIGTSKERTEAFREKWHIAEASVSFERALEDDIAVVHVCTPPALHHDMVRRLILAGKHVVCEKPLCVSPAEAKDLYETAAAEGVVAAVNFNVRYHEACGRFRDKVRSGALGRFLLLRGVYEQEFHILPAEYTWRYKADAAGPMRAVTEIGSHVIDLSRYLTGLEITSVSASCASFTPVRYVKDGIMYEEPLPGSEEISVPSDDAVTAAVRFSNGALGSLFLSEVTHGRSNYLSLELTGTKSTIGWNSEDPYKLKTGVRSEGIRCETNAFGGGFPDTFSAFFRDVYRDIDEGRPSEEPSYPAFYDGWKNAAVCDAILRSAGAGSAWTGVSG